MKKLLVLLCITFLCVKLFATEYAVVTSSDIPQLSQNQIRALFLKKRLYVDGTKIVPINLGLNSKIRKSFEKHILKMNFLRLKSYWAKEHYLGVRPPITLKSQKSMQRFVNKVSGSIGYMELKPQNSGLNVLYSWKDNVVVTSSDIPQLSQNQIRALFLKKRLYVDGTKIVPINLGLNSKIRKSFEKHILKMNFLRLKSYWEKEHYLGVQPPITLKSQKSMQHFVKKVSGSIGYMKRKSQDSGLNIIYRWKD